MASRTDRLLDKLRADNPQLKIIEGGSHNKLLVGGRLVGILPRQLAKEGLARNSVSQLRRAGLVV